MYGSMKCVVTPVGRHSLTKDRYEHIKWTKTEQGNHMRVGLFLPSHSVTDPHKIIPCSQRHNTAFTVLSHGELYQMRAIYVFIYGSHNWSTLKIKVAELLQPVCKDEQTYNTYF
jgi:hypothetical protein